MEKKDVLEVIFAIINESAEYMKVEAIKLLSCREWDFNIFEDRNTFARMVIEVLFDKEKGQYKSCNNSRKAKELKRELQYESMFIHI